MDILTHINKLLKEKGKVKRWHKVVTALACIVVFCTTYALILPAVTMERETYCGHTEHTHSDSCYSSVLICGLEENEGHVHTDDCYETKKVLVCPLEEDENHTHTEECYETVQELVCGMEEGEGAHVHSDECYEKQLICGLEEHVHTLACYSNPNADVEDPAFWEASMASINRTENLRANTAAVASSQVGYTESTKNYAVMEDGVTMKGYTRYGAWYGDPYADWDGAFAAFCYYYAGIPYDVMPVAYNCADWTKVLAERNLYVGAEGYEPRVGDLVFIDDDPNDSQYGPERVALVTEVNHDENNAPVSIKTVEGDYKQNIVRAAAYNVGDPRLYAYGILNVQDPQAEEQDEPAAEPETETDSETSAGSETGTEENKSENDPDAEEQTEAEAEPEDETKTDSESETENESETETKSESETETDSEKPAGSESVTEAPVIGTLKAEGADYTVTVDYTAEAGFPEDVVLSVSEITKDTELNQYIEQSEDLLDVDLSRKQTDARFFDITFTDAEGKEITPEAGVKVSISVSQAEAPAPVNDVQVVHFGEEAEKVDCTSENGEELNVAFETDQFSVYGVVYTVDFHYEVNGKTYEFSIPGGGFVSLEHIVELLGLAVSDTDTGNGTEDTGDNTAEDSDAEIDAVYSAVDLNALEISEETRKFVADVESAAVSSPELMWIGRNENDSTVGGLKEANGLVCEYSADLTEEQIAEINAQTVEAGDWALISMQPFETEETLTVTMKNGDQFEITITDFKEIEDSSTDTIDVNKSYIIAYKSDDGKYHVLKTDGTSLTLDADANLDKLDSTYRWMFNYVFEEKDRPDSISWTYYMARPVSHKGSTIALNAEAEELIQSSNNNVAIVPQYSDGVFDGFCFNGYNDVQLHYDNETEEFSGKVNGGSLIHIYEMETLPKYDYTVRSADEEMGTVTVSDGTEVTEDQEDGTQSHYYTAESTESESTTGKYNAGTITAEPNTHLNQGANKWVFDYWDLNGTKLEDVGATITPDEAGRLEIPYNGSVLTAHFRVNPGYVFPDDEKQGSSFEDMRPWLEDLLDRDLPLNKEGCTKTAEVYDYENRIYRVDLTSQADLTTFNGSIDLGFILDVSNSMKFPSNLQPYSDLTDVDIRNVNHSGTYLGLVPGTTYYLISDPHNTSTVYRIEWRNNEWECKDASYPDSGYKKIDMTTTFKASKDATTDNNYHYQLYYDADPGMVRFDYLNQSLENTTDSLSAILEKLTIASAQNPSVNIAFNTFNNYLNTADGDDKQDHPTPANQSQDFAPVTPIQAEFNFAAGGGTRPDRALLDALQNWHWQTGSENKYAILITDGAPQGYRNDVDGTNANFTTEQIIENQVKPAAAQLKQSGVKLITVGLSIDNVDGGRILLYDLADDINGKHMFFSAEAGSDLESILLQIVRTIMEDAAVTGNVTDKVSESFYPVDKATGMPLASGNKIDLQGNKLPDDYSGPDCGVVQDDGQTIKWLGQEFTHDGWHGTVYVKAKEDLLGGNAVQTNSGNALIEAQGYIIPGSSEVTSFDMSQSDKLKTLTIGGEGSGDLQSPRVNINELSFNGNNTEWTVYLGTEVDPKGQLEKLWDNILVEEVVKQGQSADTNGDGLPDTGAVSEDNNWYPLTESIEDNREKDGSGKKQTFKMNDLIKVLAEGQSYSWWDDANGVPDWDIFLQQAMTEEGIVIPYDAYSLNGNDNSTITIKLTKAIQTGEEPDIINASPHNTTVVNAADTDGSDVPVEKYNLTVLYSPDYENVPIGQGGQGTYDYHTGTWGTMYQGHAAGTETSRNSHVINVYAEPLDVVKKDDHGNLLSGVEFKLYRAAKEDEEGESLSSYDASLTGSYYCISAAITGEDGIAHLAPDDITTPTHTIPVANGETAKNLLVPGETYYLIETSALPGYRLDNTVRTVTVTAEPDLFTKLDKTTAVESEYISGTPARPVIAYNWDEGVEIIVKDLGSESDENQAVIVNHETREALELTDAGGNPRTYMLRSDSDQLAVAQVEIINGMITDIRIQKVDNVGKGLSGAVFQLKSVNGSEESEVTEITGIGPVTKTIDGEEVTFTSSFETTGEEQTFTGLFDGTYRLYEVYVPDGYIKTFRYIQFDIVNRVIQNVTADTGSTDKVDFIGASDDSPALVTIINEPGAALPNTGGPGTGILTLYGICLIAFAAAMMGYIKRKSASGRRGGDSL